MERIVPNEEIRKAPWATSIPGADAIVRAPYGSHPFSAPGFYLEDRQHIKEYLDAAYAYIKEKNKDKFNLYIENYVKAPKNHLEYLEKIGIRRLFSLDEYQ
ncbi:MAG: hypothetical protein JRJ08_01965 [Deltaproteobacteria bacterium]|nr:hypothetical protein [Deltaproteobacteria bacterium]